MVLERRGRVKWSHDRSNWKQEDLDACDRQAVRLACLLDGSRMSREVHVRFCERPVVQSRRPTHRGYRGRYHGAIIRSEACHSKTAARIVAYSRRRCCREQCSEQMTGNLP